MATDGYCMTSLRMTRLLLGITRRSFRPQPKGVGLKTIIEAKEAELIEIDGGIGIDRVRCKLTPKGQAAAKALSVDKAR